MATAALQVLSGLGHGLAEAMEHAGSLGLAVLAFIAIIGVIWALVGVARLPRARAVLLRVSMGSVFVVLGALSVAGVLLVGLASGSIGATFPLAPERVLVVAGVGFIACGGAWGLWCTANVLWGDEPAVIPAAGRSDGHDRPGSSAAGARAPAREDVSGTRMK